MTNKLPLVTQISKLGHEILVNENNAKIKFRAKKNDFDDDFIKFCCKIIEIAKITKINEF